MHADRIATSSQLTRTESPWPPLIQSMTSAFVRARSSKWLHQAVSGLTMLVQLSLLLSAAAISGVLLGIFI